MKARAIRATSNRRKADGALVLEVLGLEPLSLNRWQRLHWSARRRYEEKLLMILRTAWPRPVPPDSPVAVSYARSYRSRPLDQDNLIGGFKPVLDCLVELEILKDDGPEWVTIGHTFQEVRGVGPPRFAVFLVPREVAPVA